MRLLSLAVFAAITLAGCTHGDAAPEKSGTAATDSRSGTSNGGLAALRWVAIGDSYTKGEAAKPAEAWPFLAAQKLQAEGRSVELVANLGVTGDTARDVLEEQVPKLKALGPTLLTLQVGINDLVQGVDETRFRTNLGKLLDALLAIHERLIVVTIPDFSVADKAPRFGKPEEIQEGILRRNAIIIQEAEKRKLRVADVYPTSREAAKDRTLLAKDGIHPSAKGYAAWVDDVMPALREIVASKKP